MVQRRTTLFAAFALLIAVTGLQAATCTLTGFSSKEGINMTAALVNPAATVTGEVDATGCNIGVYYDQGAGAVNQANVHGANFFGVVVNGDNNAVNVNVTNSTVSYIGESPFNGTQHGVGIYYRAFGAGSTSGYITGNTVTNYQKGGIVANGNSTVTIYGNTVTGLGRVNYIAQNGIQVGYGAVATVQKNVVTGNAYTGTNCASSGGILVVGGDGYGGPYTVGTQISGNTAVNNDVGVYLSNLDANYLAPITATNIKVVNNTITNDALSNISGLESTCGSLSSGGGYQAGISDVGNNDKMINNAISGVGYTYPGNPGVTFATNIDADTSFTNRPKVQANK